MSFLSRLRIFGTSRSGQVREVPINNNGSIPVEITQNTTFNEVIIAEKTPVLQMTFPYPIHNTDIINDLTSVGSGGLTFADSFMKLNSGATTLSIQTATTVDSCKYRSGEGVEVKFGARFIYTDSFGSSPAIYGGVSEGGATPTDGYFFAFDKSNSSEFAIVHINNSVYSYVEQSNWNIDKMDGTNGVNNPSGETLNAANGNIYKIEFQYLGFGDIYFSIENKETGKFQLVHILKYANTNTVTSLKNPTLKGFFSVKNDSGTDNQEIYISSFAMFIQGKIIETNGITNSVKVVSVDGTARNGHLLTMQERDLYGGVTNLVISTLTQIMLANNSTSFETVDLIENGSFTGQSFANVNTNNSTVEVDIAGTYTASTGKILTTYGLAKTNGVVNQIIKDLHYHSNGKSLSLVCSASSNNMTATLTFSEDF